jgi:polysaccharide pyruvyl transferase WcaK-like protein
MHACIAALSQEVPAVGLAYSDKFAGVFESAGVGAAVIDLRTCDAISAVEQTLQNFEHRAALTMLLRERIRAVRCDVADTFSSMVRADNLG